MKKIIFIPLILFLLIIPSHFIHSAVPQAERDALVALYNSTDGDNWDINYNWLKGDPCGNNWYGIICDLGDTTVYELDVSNNNLVKSLPNWGTSLIFGGSAWLQIS